MALPATTITLPFNCQGFLYSAETDWTARLIRNCPLRMPRIQPPTGFCRVYSNAELTLSRSEVALACGHG